MCFLCPQMCLQNVEKQEEICLLDSVWVCWSNICMFSACICMNVLVRKKVWFFSRKGIWFLCGETCSMWTSPTHTQPCSAVCVCVFQCASSCVGEILCINCCYSPEIISWWCRKVVFDCNWTKWNGDKAPLCLGGPCCKRAKQQSRRKTAKAACTSFNEAVHTGSVRQWTQGFLAFWKKISWDWGKIQAPLLQQKKCFF